MKKILFCLMAVLCCALATTACNDQSQNLASQTNASSQSVQQNAQTVAVRLSLVATTFPQYDWLRQVLGARADEVDLHLLLQDGVDLHSYQPTVEDMATIANCDMVIYIGGETDGWVEDALQNNVKERLAAINLLQILGDKVKEEEIIAGMEHEHEHEDEGDEHEHEHELDEHVWLSLQNAQFICTHIVDELSLLDPANAALYSTNAAEYIAALTELDAEYRSVIDAAEVRTLLFGDRFPFRYLIDDYGLSYHAAFAGCSAETEASFETIAYLSRQLDELNLKYVLVIEGSDNSVATTIIANTKAKDQKILVLNSLQSVTTQDISSGTTYLNVMQSNLEVLRKALS